MKTFVTLAAAAAFTLSVGGLAVAQTSSGSMKSGATDPSGQATPAGPAAKKPMESGMSKSGAMSGGMSTGAGENKATATGGQPGGNASKN